MTAQSSLSYMQATPGTKLTPLSSGEEAPSAQGLLMVDAQGKWGVLVAAGLTPPPENMAYQVWLRGEVARYPVATLLVDETGWGIAILRPGISLDLYKWVGITMVSMDEAPSASGPQLLWGNIPH